MNVDLATVCYAREKLEFIKQSPNDLITEVKCMIRMMYVAITRRGVWGADNTNFSPPYLQVLQTPLATYQRLI